MKCKCGQEMSYVGREQKPICNSCQDKKDKKANPELYKYMLNMENKWRKAVGKDI